MVDVYDDIALFFNLLVWLFSGIYGYIYGCSLHSDNGMLPSQHQNLSNICSLGEVFKER